MKLKNYLGSEKDLCNNIVTVLNMKGCHVWRQNAGMIAVETATGSRRVIRVGQPGQSDIIGIRKRDGRFIAIEVKKPQTRSRVTPLQSLWLKEMTEYGALAGVATSEEEALEIVAK